MNFTALHITKPIIYLLAFMVLCAGISTASAQPAANSQEVSEVDGQPVLLKHLPAHEAVQSTAAFVTDKQSLTNLVGGRPILDVIEFFPGTEAATALYPEGRLVIVEFSNPQSSTETDAKIQEYLARNPEQSTVYRRIGNYSAFVFDAADPDAASSLLDQVKYEKTIQWLGDDPFSIQKLERYLVTTSRDIMISTILVIVLGLGGSVLAGIAAGFLFFRFREQKRATRSSFSDAGGLTRLNLDGLSE